MLSDDRRLALRVLTLNLWAMGGSWTDRRQVIAEGIQTLDPDLMAFQEAVKDADPTLPIIDCRLAFDQPVDGIWASDHFGVVADLEWK